MKNSIKLKKVSILLGDIIILFSSLYLTLFVRYSQSFSQEIWLQHFWPFSGIFVCWILIFYIMGLYNLNLATNDERFVRTIFNGLAIVSILSALFFYLNLSEISPKTNLAVFILIFAVLFLSWRRFFNWSIRKYVPRTNVAIVGFNERAEEVIRELQRKPQLGYHVSFVFDPEMNQNIDGVKTLNNNLELEKLVEEEKIKTIVLATHLYKTPELRNSLFKCLKLGVNYMSLVSFYENIIGKIPIDTINQMWFLENLNEGGRYWFSIAKRTYDMTFSFLGLVATIIFWPIIAVIIKMESKGPVFFKQIRYGQNGKEFLMIKFRTMTVSGNDFAPTKENDARVTKFGSFMRKTRVDEIPQIINILKGEMSFVGPRPERPELANKLKLSIPFYDERMLVKPGVTGWDQISGEYHSPSVEDTYKKLQYDLYYIKNRSIYLDISIILKTIATVLSKGGR